MKIASKLKSGVGSKIRLARLTLFGLCYMGATVAAVAQTQLEFAAASYPSAPNGPSIANVAGTFLNNTSGSTFVSYTPTVTVTAVLSDQQYTNVASSTYGMFFGATLNNSAKSVLSLPVWNTLGSVSAPAPSLLTSNPIGTAGTGIDTNLNYGFNMFCTVEPQYAASTSTSGRYYYGKITLKFSRAVSNPVLHVVGLGGTHNGSSTLGFSTELELQTAGITLSKLSGNSNLVIGATNTSILNGATAIDASSAGGAATGSVRVDGSNITSLEFKVYMRGDGRGSSWSSSTAFSGDRWLLGFSMNVPVISGTVYNDVNGLTDNTVNGNGTDLYGQLYVNLVDAAGNVAAVADVAADGSYVFQDVIPSSYPSTYSARLCRTPGTIGSPAPVASLPAGWLNTGEFIGATAGSDGAPNGVLPGITLSSGNAVVNNINFGINQAPTAAIVTMASQGNPGGTNSVAIAASSFLTSTSGTNPNTLDSFGGTVNNIRFTGFPTNATSFAVGTTTYYPNGTALPGSCPTATCANFPASGGLTIAYTNNVGPTSAITLDPADGNVSSVFTYAAVDNAGQESVSTGSVTVPFSVISVSGHAWNDADGSSTKNGTEQYISGNNTSSGGSVVTGGNLYANLVNAAGRVIASSQLATDGTFSFANAPANTSGLKIQLSANQGTVDQAMPATAQPTGWITTGNAVGAGNTASQSGTTGIINLTTAAASITGQDFGMERKSTADAKSASIGIPTINQLITLDGTGANPPALTGSDPEDQPASATLSGKRVAITSLPTKGQLWYNGAQVSSTGTLPGTFNPSLLQFKATGVGYTSTTFQYAYVDAANVTGTAASYSLSWARPLPVKLVSFTGYAQSCTAVLQWETATEESVRAFDIERSRDGVSFTKAGTLSAQGGGVYNFRDEMDGAGQWIYRLAVVEENGSVTYSQVVKIQSDCGSRTIKLYPNPASSFATVAGLETGDQVAIYATDGHLVEMKSSSAASLQMDLGRFAPGYYQVLVRNAEGQVVKTEKLLKQ